MSSEGLVKDMNLVAVNKLFRVCFNYVAKNTQKELSESDLGAVHRCHQRLQESFKILHPYLLKQEHFNAAEELAESNDAQDDDE